MNQLLVAFLCSQNIRNYRHVRIFMSTAFSVAFLWQILELVQKKIFRKYGLREIKICVFVTRYQARVNDQCSRTYSEYSPERPPVWIRLNICEEKRSASFFKAFRAAEKCVDIHRCDVAMTEKNLRVPLE